MTVRSDGKMASNEALMAFPEARLLPKEKPQNVWIFGEHYIERGNFCRSSDED